MLRKTPGGRQVTPTETAMQRIILHTALQPTDTGLRLGAVTIRVQQPRRFLRFLTKSQDQLVWISACSSEEAALRALQTIWEDHASWDVQLHVLEVEGW